KIHKNIMVKVPLTPEGLKACKALASEGIKVNVTLCFPPSQALLAAKAGAWCVSPFIGRLDDISEHGMGLIQDIVTIYRNYHFKTKVLVASVRHPRHVVEAAKIGGDICTISYAVFCACALCRHRRDGRQRGSDGARRWSPPLPRPAGRHQRARHGSHPGHRDHRPELPLQVEGGRGPRPPSSARGGGRQDGGGHLH